MKVKLAAFADEAGEALDTQIAAMQRNGIEYLEIRGVDGQNVSELSAEKAREVRQKLEAAGLAVWSVGSPFGKINIEDGFLPHLDAFKRGLETANILGARHLRLFSFYVPKGRAEDCRDEVFARMEQFLAAAEGSGVLLCHENEKGIYGDTDDRCLDILVSLKGKIKGVFDPANFIQCGVDILPAYEKLREHIEYMHIKDAQFSDGSVVPPGSGDGHIKELLALFAQKEGKRFLTLEPHLKVFDGLEKLEQKGGTADKLKNVFTYKTNSDAFRAAADALHGLLAAVGCE